MQNLAGVITLNDTNISDAREGVDYELVSKSLLFADGDMDPKAIVLRIFNNQMVEPLKQIGASHFAKTDRAFM